MFKKIENFYGHSAFDLQIKLIIEKAQAIKSMKFNYFYSKYLDYCIELTCNQDLFLCVHFDSNISSKYFEDLMSC